MRNLDLISLGELEEIRRIWVVDKHEFEDRLPVIYREATGEPYEGVPMDEHLPLDADDVALLRELAGDDRLHFELVRELLDVEQRHRAMTRRAGLFDALEGAMRRGFYATERALRRRDVRQSQPAEDDATTLFDVDPIFAREAPVPSPDGTRQS